MSTAFAFPEMVTHGYVNCMACHESSTGGGLLTPYGRALSKELLSAKSSEKIKNEEQFLKGWISPPKNIELGGDIRFMQMFLDNKFETSGRAILMQADLEAQLTLDSRTRILATAGRLETSTTPSKITDTFISRRHWLNLLIGPDDNKEKYQIRLGRFFPAYGLNIPEHNTVTRRGLGFDQNQESYNAELAFIGADWNMFATVIAGRPDKKELDREKGGALQILKSIDSKSKIGLNFYSGNGVNHTSLDRRTLLGVNSIYSIAPKLYSLLEFNRSYSPKKSYGYYEYGKIGYEYIQGLHFYLSGEYEKPSALNFDKKITAGSIGIQYFPWVHWELNSVFRREKNTFVSKESSNILLLLLHCYL
jgi:hypothetical protein